MQTQAERRAQARARFVGKARQYASAVAAEKEHNLRAPELERQRAEAAQTRRDLNRSYGNAVRDISRDASRRGLTSNKPLKVNVGGYVISTAPQTQPLTREQLLSEYY